MTEVVSNISGWVVIACLGPALYATFRYGLGAAWYTSWLGRVIFAQWISIDVVLLFIVSRRLFGEYRGYHWVALIVYTALLFAFIAKAVIIDIEMRTSDFVSVVRPPADKLSATKEDVMTTPKTPEIWYKTQRVLRTIFAVLTSALAVWAGFALVAPQILAELATILPGSWIAWLTGVIAAISTVAGVITRILAIPAVNNFLTKVGLGSVPKSAVIPVNNLAVVKRDPKVR